MSKGNDSEALDRAKLLCQERDRRARELRAEGKRVIGYFCCYPPLEIMTAADLVPYRITGSVKEPITKADAYLETIMCPFIRSCFDLAIKGDYDFLDGLIVPHTCDALERTYLMWRYYLKLPYCYYLDIPHKADASSYYFFRAELDTFRKSLEEFTGGEISENDLQEAISLHNENRALLRELYSLRKLDPPLLSGSEMTEVMVSLVSLPVAEANGLLREIIQEVKQRRRGPGKKARLLLYGCEVDDPAFSQLIEDCGADVVMDDLCMGTRSCWHDVEGTADALTSIAARYLDKIPCPRTYREEDPDIRFRYLLEYAREFNVNGVILYIIRFCDTHEFDAPDVRDYLQGEGLPVLHIEDDYSITTIGQLRTRIQAFIERIS